MNFGYCCFIHTNWASMLKWKFIAQVFLFIHSFLCFLIFFLQINLKLSINFLSLHFILSTCIQKWNMNTIESINSIELCSSFWIIGFCSVLFLLTSPFNSRLLFTVAIDRRWKLIVYIQKNYFIFYKVERRLGFLFIQNKGVTTIKLNQRRNYIDLALKSSKQKRKKNWIRRIIYVCL